MKFQEELVETLTFLATKVENEVATAMYRVTKFEDNRKAYCVNFNVHEVKATCSCQMFEFSGLLCRHILTVFRVTNVLTLPPRYVLKRWTRNAKSGVILEEHTNALHSSSQESLTCRYNSLRREALKYVDEGTKSFEIYNIAMDALQEAANKVALAKKTGGKVTIANGASIKDHPNQGRQANNTYGTQQWSLEQPASMVSSLSNTLINCLYF